MTHYRTALEQMSLIIPLIFFIVNNLFKHLGEAYFEFSLWWLLLFLVFPIAHILQFKFNTFLTIKIFYFFVQLALFQGLFVIFRFIVYFIDKLTGFQTSLFWIIIWVLFFQLIGYSYYISIPLKYLKIKTNKLTEQKRIIQISDSHLHGQTATPFLKKLVGRISNEKPDIVVITGDLLDYFGLPAKNCLDAFDNLDCPVYYIYGNHENHLLKDYASKLIEKSCLIPLVNESIKFEEFQIVGINDGSNSYLEKEISKIQIDKNLFSLFLIHKPRHVSQVADKGVDLMLSGHTHAGQSFPLDVILRFRWKYLVGLYHEKQMKLYVSKGTGTRSFPFRLFVRNELTVIDLLPENLANDQN